MSERYDGSSWSEPGGSTWSEPAHAGWNERSTSASWN
jgi:hypothetical protein